MRTEAAKTATAIRAELKAKYPSIKFSVTSENFSGGNAVRIQYTDGPTYDAVQELTGKFQFGHFDGMTDCYEYSNTIEDLPQVKYITISRNMSDQTSETLEAFIPSNSDNPDNAKHREFVKLDLTKDSVGEAYEKLELIKEEEYRAYQADQEKARAEYEAREAAAKEADKLLENVEVKDLEESEQYMVDGIMIVRKCNNLKDLDECLKDNCASEDRAKIVREIHLTPEQMDVWCSDFFRSRKQIAGMGGTDSDYELGREVENFWDMTEEEQKLWGAQSYMLAVRVTDGTRDLVIDPQGHDYSRYVGYFPTEETVVEEEEIVAVMYIV